MTQERRHFPRLGLRFNVSYTISGTKKQGAGVTANISGVGIRFTAEHRLEVGTLLDLRIALPDRAQPITCTGEVVWSQSVSKASSEQTDVGVRFVTIRPEDRKCLAQYALMYPDASKE